VATRFRRNAANAVNTTTVTAQNASSRRTKFPLIEKGFDALDSQAGVRVASQAAHHTSGKRCVASQQKAVIGES
jgi:hypothetical protein